MSKNERTIVIILNYLSEHTFQARIVITAMSIGFVLVAIGVMFNLMSSSSVFKLVINHLLK